MVECKLLGDFLPRALPPNPLPQATGALSEDLHPFYFLKFN